MTREQYFAYVRATVHWVGRRAPVHGVFPVDFYWAWRASRNFSLN